MSGRMTKRWSGTGARNTVQWSKDSSQTNRLVATGSHVDYSESSPDQTKPTNQSTNSKKTKKQKQTKTNKKQTKNTHTNKQKTNNPPNNNKQQQQQQQQKNPNNPTTKNKTKTRTTAGTKAITTTKTITTTSPWTEPDLGSCWSLVFEDLVVSSSPHANNLPQGSLKFRTHVSSDGMRKRRAAVGWIESHI